LIESALPRVFVLLILIFFSFGYRSDKKTLGNARTEEGYEVTLDDVTEGKVTVDKIKNVQNVVIHNQEHYLINSYQFAMAPKDGQSFLMDGFGFKLLNNMKQHILNAKPGDLIVLAHVKAKGADGLPMTVRGASYIVVKE